MAHWCLHGFRNIFRGIFRGLAWVLVGYTTLVMIGVVLLPILAVVVFIGMAFGVDPKTQAAQILNTRMGFDTIGTALDAFSVDLDRYPTKEDGLNALVVKPGSDREGRWRGPYIKHKEELLDAWRHEYIYQYPSKYPDRKYDVLSTGPDGRLGTADDITINASRWNEIVRTRIRINALTKALKSFRWDVGRYPTTQEGLEALRGRSASVPEKKWKGPYFHPAPSDAWGTDIRYTFPSSEKGKKFDLVSAGPDKTFGTDDDLTTGWDGMDFETGIKPGSMRERQQ